MPSLKSLARETAIYGMSSIVGRFLNYLLVPLYTAKLSAAGGGYGVITNMYAYTALALVILTYGMETSFFRFASGQAEGYDVRKVYSNVLTMVGSTSLLFIVVVSLLIHPLSGLMGYKDHPWFVWSMAMTVAIDAFQCIPFALLRLQKKALKFAALKLLFVIVNIGLNLVFFLWLYDPSIGAGYAFYINLFTTALITLFFWKEIALWRPSLDRELTKRLLRYGWPILVLGIAGILNQTADKILFPYIYRGEGAHEQLGIYGAASKIAMIMAMITQAFRYAYEPFVFGRAAEKDSKQTQARAMLLFISFTLLAFLMVMGYIDIIKHIIGRDYWPGLRVVPIVMAAEIMMGIYFNLSFWYKLIDKTIWGAWLSGIGCMVLISINILFVPRYGYMACAWAGFVGYGVAMTLSWLLGRKYYPIPYPLRSIMLYVAVAIVAFGLIKFSSEKLSTIWSLVANTIVIMLFAGLIYVRELRVKQ